MSDLNGNGLEQGEVELHGHRVSFQTGGSGPLLILIHGITGSSANWDPVLPLLAERFTILAPDLLGHGASAKPRGDYSLGAYASMVRDLAGVLGHDRATVVGHSLGGGIAMQLAYQFPERVERMVLVSSGGLGREVHPILRAATLPGSEFILPLLTARPLMDAGAAVGRFLGQIGLDVGPDLTEMGRGFASLGELESRSAFVHTARAVIDVGGQRVDASDRLYLAAALPTLLVWGERDQIIPARHGREAHELIPGSRLELLERAGHFPHHDEPVRFARILRDFVDGTEGAHIDEAHQRELLLHRAEGQRPVTASSSRTS
jgi:pimeloyl-ACP methyl ester carboxylesterase